MPISKVLAAMSCFVNCSFPRITGMFLIKVHSTFDSQTVIMHSHFKSIILVFLFESILLSYIYVYWILKKECVCLCGAFSALYKEYASWSILSPRVLFTNMHNSNKLNAWFNHAHKCICAQMSKS